MFLDWEEAEVCKENPDKQMENMQCPHRQDSAEI